MRPAPSTSSLPITQNEDVEATINGYVWTFGAGTPRVIAWSVSGSKWNHPNLQAAETQEDFSTLFNNIAYYIDVAFSPLGYFSSTATKTGYQLAYDAGSEMNISFGFNGVDSAGRAVNDSRFSSTGQTAFCYFPFVGFDSTIYQGAAGDTWLNYNNQFIASLTFEEGTNGFALMLHEVLHGLGLKHPHDSGGTNRPTYTDLDIPFADRQWISVMSYDRLETGGDGAYTGSMPIAPMLMDVIALQYLYGESTGSAGNSTHDLSIYSGRYYNTLWDSGGVDTLSASSVPHGLYVDMGSFEASNGTKDHFVGYVTTALDKLSLQVGGFNPSNWTWLWGEYENFDGSAYADTILGNDLPNDLNGDRGNDYLVGGLGDDRFDWDPDLRAGSDTFEGGQGDDIYVLDSRLDRILEQSMEGIDTVFVGFDYTLDGTALEDVSAFSDQTTAVTFTGNTWGNRISGGGGSDRLQGRDGNDTIEGGGGNDIIDGGADTDTVVFPGARSEYLISRDSKGNVSVADKFGVSDTLNNVELIQTGPTTAPASGLAYLPGFTPTPSSSTLVYRFYNDRDKAFFYTTSVAERDAIIKQSSDPSYTPADPPWPYFYQGATFEQSHSSSGSMPLYRFYNTKTGHHFFTASAAERDNIVRESTEPAFGQPGVWTYRYEGTAFNAFADARHIDATPVYRFYSPTLDRHFFTANPVEVQEIALTGVWRNEGVVFYGELPG